MKSPHNYSVIFYFPNVLLQTCLFLFPGWNWDCCKKCTFCDVLRAAKPASFGPPVIFAARVEKSNQISNLWWKPSSPLGGKIQFTAKIYPLSCRKRDLIKSPALDFTHPDIGLKQAGEVDIITTFVGWVEEEESKGMGLMEKLLVAQSGYLWPWLVEDGEEDGTNCRHLEMPSICEQIVQT